MPKKKNASLDQRNGQPMSGGRPRSARSASGARASTKVFPRKIRAGYGASEKPQWNYELRQLTLRSKLVKRFRQPSTCQEIILVAFQELGWPPSMDDPLPQKREMDPKRRLRDTVQALNRYQVNRLLRFRLNGEGTGILWEAL
jgi:hypothetical protein